jgi:tetratricopeptide (TPR) repeat protein
MPSDTGFLRRPLFGLGLALAAFTAWAAADWYIAEPDGALARAQYVGRASCIECHQPEAAAWSGSDHDLAMDLATDQTVLGDFKDAEFSRFGERTRFFRDGKRFMVNAEGPDGQYHDYEVKYTFGVRPLQQYMVEFPGGRIQVLRVSWDVNARKWFYVAPVDAVDERIEPGDPLHWTGLAQNWNTMCAECHVTDYRKNYDLASNSYHSKYFEIDVSCESCHGPGSVHVALAKSRSLFWDRRIHYGLTNVLKGATAARQVQTCAPCHSRRAIIHPDYRPGDSFLDFFEPSLLEQGLYYADGQILDEVYEYGSFTQSKMYHQGVRCTDCHDPHSLKLKFEGNRLCAQCHQPGKYDGVGHHRHAGAAPGAPETQCVTCHMPTSIYMGIDARRDHAIRVPRPDLTVSIGTPNVCNRCHDKPHETAQWAANAVTGWYGTKRPDDPHYAPAIEAARRGEAEGSDLLRGVLMREQSPDIVRATAVELLARYANADSERLRRDALSDPSPLVRAAAVRSFVADSPARLVQAVGPKLDDRSRIVRMAAASRLVAGARELAASEFRGKLKQAVADFREAQAIHLDRAQSNRNLANLSLDLGDPVAAIESLRTAIRQEPYLTGPRTELSQLLDQMIADPSQAKAVQRSGGSAEEVRRLREEEIKLLKRDAELLPEDPSPRYQLGRLLFLTGEIDQAREAFAEATRLAPNEYEYWLWLALICERQQRWEGAVDALKNMSRLRPDADEWKGIRQRIIQTLRAKGELPADGVPAGAAAPAADDSKPASSPGIAPEPVTPGQVKPPAVEQGSAVDVGQPTTPV